MSLMTTQETFVTLLAQGLPQLFTAAKAMPEDKYDWKPSETSRTAHELVVECVTMLTGSAGMLTTRAMPAGHDEQSKTYTAMTLAEIEVQAARDLEVLNAAIRAFPEADLEEALEMPWGKMTFFEIMSYPYWNIMWHAGQINYIQTLYGDTEMH